MNRSKTKLYLSAYAKDSDDLICMVPLSKEAAVLFYECFEDYCDWISIQNTAIVEMLQDCGYEINLKQAEFLIERLETE